MTISMIDYVNRFFHSIKQAIDCYTVGDDGFQSWIERSDNLLHIVARRIENNPNPENMRTFDTMLEMMTMLYTLQAYQKTHCNIAHYLKSNSLYHFWLTANC